MKHRRRFTGGLILAVVAMTCLGLLVPAYAGSPAHPVKGFGETYAISPFEFEGTGALIIGGVEHDVSIYTMLLGDPVPGSDGTLHAATSHTFTFTDGSTLVTMDRAVLDPITQPCLFRLNSVMHIVDATGMFAGFSGKMTAHGDIDLCIGETQFSIRGVLKGP
jgi:hypothetical protein